MRILRAHQEPQHIGGPLRREGKELRGVVTLELILVFPILMILLLAIIEFGLIYSTIQHVSYSSRLGAKLSSEQSTVNLGTYNQNGGVSPLRTEINNYLTTAGFNTLSCQITLQHNVAGAANNTQENPDPAPAGCDCVAPVNNLPVGSEYVRVTVCVPVTGNVPNLLATFGFDIADYEVEETTTFPYE